MAAAMGMVKNMDNGRTDNETADMTATSTSVTGAEESSQAFTQYKTHLSSSVFGANAPVCDCPVCVTENAASQVAMRGINGQQTPALVIEKPTADAVARLQKEQALQYQEELRRSQEGASSSRPLPFGSMLWSCCSHMEICCLGFWCPCLLFGRNIDQAFREDRRRPTVGSLIAREDVLGPAPVRCNRFCLMHCLLGGCVVGCAPLLTSRWRTRMRERYNLRKSRSPCLGDLGTACLCHHCALCQEAREIAVRRPTALLAASAPAPAVIASAPVPQRMDKGDGMRHIAKEVPNAPIHTGPVPKDIHAERVPAGMMEGAR